jgi:putative methionine-R-sulfoxide reductase with GAF domain
MIAGTDQPSAIDAVGDNSNESRALEEAELNSVLQLLVERAQYITGATGTALALPQGEEMVCRASAGASAPAVGARLQVRSGLTGESIARRQLLRCDNAEADARVNLEACRALGIASIVVLPLLRRNGEVRGLFELFSDHPYAFEERDLIALERMAALTLTALDLSEQRQTSSLAQPPAPAAAREPEKSVESAIASTAEPVPAQPIPVQSDPVQAAPVQSAPVIPIHPEVAEPTVPATVAAIEPPVVSLTGAEPESAPAPVPEAMLRVQKCASCGFPISEGRTLCLDCEKKDTETKQREKELRQIEQQKTGGEKTEQHADGQETTPGPAAPMPEEFVPAFLANSAPLKESWLSNPVNLLAVAVLIVGILVAVVVFR